MNKFNELCNEFVTTGDWRDFYRIFSTKSGLTFDYVNSVCSNLGRSYPGWLPRSTKNILSRLPELIDLYMSPMSVSDVCDIVNLPKTSVQFILGSIGVLRTKSEAAVTTAIHKINSYKGGNYKCIYRDVIYPFKSSYELFYFNQLVIRDDILSIEYEPISIPYKDTYGLDHHYIPDFLIKYKCGKIELVEVKPSFMLTDDIVILKSKAADEFCIKHGYEYTIVTEDVINFNELIDDIQLINHEESEYGFITHIHEGTYTYLEHPRTNINITYESIMNFINSHERYSLTIWDIYEIISRNSLITRLRDEAPNDEKDIRRWMCKYLSETSLKGPKFDIIKLEYQKSGIRDFGLPTLDDIIVGLKSLNREVKFCDYFKITGFGRNKLLKYFYETLDKDPYEVIEEINREFTDSNKSI